MISGSRRRLSIKKQSYAVPNEHFNEPLHFLHPRWFHTAAATHQHSAKTSTAPLRPVWLDSSLLSASESPGSNNTSNTPSQCAWTDLSQYFSQASSRAPRQRARTASPSQHGNKGLPQRSQAKLATTEDRWRPPKNASRSRDSIITNPQASETGATTLPLKLATKDLSSTKNAVDFRDYEPRLKIRRPPTPAYRPVLAKSPEPNAKTIKKEATKTLHDPAGIEWSEPIRLLARLIYRPKEMRGERLELHANTVYHLTGGINTNAWFHQVGWGCEVRVLEEQAGDPDKLVVVLHGMPRARRLTREYLLEADRGVTDAARWRLSPKDDLEPVRFVLSSLKWHNTTKDVRRADMVEHPRSWSVRSFAHFVETLTTMQIPRQLQRELYEGTETHNRTVAQVLESLFADPRSAPFISSRALNFALVFTCKHTEIGGTSNFLFEKAKSIGLSLQADTFNILIEESLRQNKLDYYRSLLASMQRMGVVPDGMTWVALLRITKSRAGRRAILQHLRQKWPKNTILWQQVALELVSTDFAQLVRLEKSFDYFVDFMDQSFPSTWLSVRSINRMLNICAKKKLWHIVPRILEFGERRGGHFNTATQTLLLKVFQKRGSIRDSIDLLESHFAKTVGRDSAFAIPVIFMTAWNSRFYNVCRVLWRYAAVHGDITSTMQNVVALSLIKNNDESDDSAAHRWRITAGKVIVGTDLDTSGLAAQYQLMNQEGMRDPMKVLAQWTPDDGPRQEQLALAYTIMHRDLTAYKGFERFGSEQLFDLLRRAYEIDCDWMHKKKVREYSDLGWMIESAIEVPLQPLADPSVSPRHLLWQIDADSDGRGREDLAFLDRPGD